MKSPIWFGVSLLAIASCGLAGASDHSPCDLLRTRTGWHVFVDDQDRFCFEYPREYHVAPTVFAPGVSTGDATRFIGRSRRRPRQVSVPAHTTRKMRRSTHLLTEYLFDWKISPNARQPETLRRSLFMPCMGTFITTAAVEVA
jgi:hypothetical protein